jgi:hypothetical protein
LSQQIHPVITRLCEPIEGIDAYHIAQSLGLDPSGFKHKRHHDNASSIAIALPQLTKQQKRLENFKNELEKYSNCVPFKYVCPDCKNESVWQSPFIRVNADSIAKDYIKKEPSIKKEPIQIDMSDLDNIEIDDEPDNDYDNGVNKLKCILESCSNHKCKTKPLQKIPYIKNLVSLQIGKFIKQYYQVSKFL